MEFLKKMRSRDTLEMVLKTIMAVLIAIILIFFMEAMIHSIYIKKIKENTNGPTIPAQQIAYCEEIDTNKYRVYVHDIENSTWHTLVGGSSKEYVESRGFKEVYFRQPNAFDVSITWVHYIVMGVFVVAVLGFYGYRFYKLDKDYAKFTAKLQKTGKLFG